ncbi:MAG: carboxypeptidase-like regulatory domain-containing protein [Planctomycetota bacterium]
MRRLMAVVLVLAMTSLGAPVGALAQTSTAAQPGSVSGEALDAGGRALVGQPVELVQAGLVLQTTTTGSRGEWTFASVSPGDYVVRVVINGRVAGIRVSLAPGQALAGEMIVAPSAAAPSAAFIQGMSNAQKALFFIALGAAIGVTIYFVTAS